MGRKKAITTEQLIMLIDEYFNKVCDGDVLRLKIPEICKYIRENDYPELKDYIIRRNDLATAHIEELKHTSDVKNISLVVAYKTIDVEKFINSNRGDSKLKKALTQLDQYHKSVCEAAFSINNKYKKADIKIKELEQKIKNALAELQILQDNATSLKQENKVLIEQQKILKKVIKTYVYPEIANELLANAGLLKNTAGIVDMNAVEENLIKANTEIKSESNVIKGMFDKFGV